MKPAEESATINLSQASVLLVEKNQHALDVLGQIFQGFGTRELFRCIGAAEAEKILERKQVDLIVIEPDLKDSDGIEFVRNLRASGKEPNCYVPIIMIPGHTRKSDVAKVRDTGANFVVRKPLTPRTLLQRILWVAKDKRPFVEMGHYIGPDRRFKFEGPPADSEGRRSGDLSGDVTEAAAPNMSQGEIDDMIKPQRVSL